MRVMVTCCRGRRVVMIFFRLRPLLAWRSRAIASAANTTVRWASIASRVWWKIGRAASEPPRCFRRLRVVSSPGRAETVSCSVVDGLDLGGGEVVDGFVGAFGVPPVDPVEGFQFDVLEAAPVRFPPDRGGISYKE